MHAGAAGIFSVDDELTRAAIAEGFQVISHTADFAIYQSALRSQLTAMRSWASDSGE